MSNALLSLNWLNFFWPMCAMGLGRMRGYWLVLLLALAALPVRGLLAAAIQTPWVLIPVQILDGVGAGLLGMAVPGLVARILNGTGRFNAGFAALMTIQGVGAALSTSIGGAVAHHFSYALAFVALWLAVTPSMKSARQGAQAAA